MDMIDRIPETEGIQPFTEVRDPCFAYSYAGQEGREGRHHRSEQTRILSRQSAGVFLFSPNRPVPFCALCDLMWPSLRLFCRFLHRFAICRKWLFFGSRIWAFLANFLTSGRVFCLLLGC